MSDNPNDSVSTDPNRLGNEPVANQEPQAQEGHIDSSPNKVPEKLEGKSIEEVIEIYTNLESQYTKVTSELSTAEKAKDEQAQQLQKDSRSTLTLC